MTGEKLSADTNVGVLTKPSGVTYADITAGVDVAFREAKGLNHDDDLRTHIEPMQARVREVVQVQ
jgi:hypothetical protein